MLLEGFCSYGTNKFKRLMAYSSISHIGYVLAALTVGNRDVRYFNNIIFKYLHNYDDKFICMHFVFLKEKNVYFENIYDLSGLSK